MSARWPKPNGHTRSTARWISAVRGPDAPGASGSRARRAGGLEQQRPRGVHGAEVCELGAVGELRTRRRAVHAQHPAVLQRNEVAAPQSGEPDRGVALRGEIAHRREADEAALGREIEPAGDWWQGGSRIIYTAPSAMSCQP